MKTIKAILNKSIVLFTLLFGVFIAMAQSPPAPSPTGRTKPPPPGLAIDQDIIWVFVIALFFGIYIIYTRQLYTKTPA